jgi:hypothetical protein
MDKTVKLACAVIKIADCYQRIDSAWCEGIDRQGITWQKIVAFIAMLPMLPILAILLPLAAMVEGWEKLEIWARKNCQ